MKPIKYYIQTLFGSWLNLPIIPKDKTTGFSLVRSERSNCKIGKKAYAVAPYYLHNVQLGDYSYFAKNAHVANTTIGKFCSIGPNLCCGLGVHPTNGISTHPMFYRGNVSEYKPVTIGNDVFIGANVTILDGVTIGDGAVIGAGAVVSKDIPPYAIAVGCPIEIKKGKNPVSSNKHFKILEQFGLKIDPGLIICTADNLFPINREIWYCPVGLI